MPTCNSEAEQDPYDAVKNRIKIYINVPTASFSTDLLFPCGVPSGGSVSLIVGDFAELEENSRREKVPFVLKQKLVINTPNREGKPLCIPKPCNAAWSLESFWKCLMPNNGTVTLSAQHLGIEDDTSENNVQARRAKSPPLDTDDDVTGSHLQPDDTSQLSAVSSKRRCEEEDQEDGGITIFKKKVRADALFSDVSSGSHVSECTATENEDDTPTGKPRGQDANFICGLCDKTFPTRYSCQQHVWEHIPLIEKLFECSRCSSTFTTAFAHDRHDKSCQLEKIRHPCATCDAVFDTTRELEKHSWIHKAKVTVYCCEYCGWQFMLKVHYDLHVASNHKPEVEASDTNAKILEAGVQVFACTLCSLIFTSEEQREKHKESKHEVKLVTRETRQFYVCPVCFKHISASFYVFNKHMALHRQPDRIPKFHCSECNTKFLTLGGYRHHMTLHKESEPHCCEQCPRTFRTAFYLRKHIETVHTKELNYPCRFCPRKFVNEQKLRLHLAVLHEQLLNDDERLLISSLKLYPCDHCSFTTYSQKVIKNHVSGHTGVYPFHCSVCKKGYSYKYQLTQHMAMTHMSEGGKCEDCGRVFYNDTSFQRHQAAHASNSGFPCEHCSKMYESEGLRRRHIVDNHPQGEQDTHSCNICGKSFNLETSLRLHKRSAHEKRQPKRPGRRFPQGLICDVCGVDFKFVASLEAHKVVKHNTIVGQDIICPYCEKKSTSQLALSVHMRLHFNEKPFKCKYCEKLFTLHASCKSHERRHERKKQFVCPHCESKFLFESRLKRHLMTFHSALYDDQVAVMLGHVVEDDENEEQSQEEMFAEENGELLLGDVAAEENLELLQEAGEEEGLLQEAVVEVSNEPQQVLQEDEWITTHMQ